ncbi:hypothetical protein BOX15_Mlig022849g4 [Macrostomum lignano]|uniref:Uncharacterized protein n=1 Tax=Macrostomum lignano TaxID=282301 RepID=A0A267DF78_9PLAT|nr:hypothetical protein BOX15_Mlig022849g2 [Macrostomum lignano]PAA80667.1 hypothetical protein BOX15_Mlig022849g4 [Macrostomum lignano]
MSQEAEEEPVSVRSISVPLLPEAAASEAATEVSVKAAMEGQRAAEAGSHRSSRSRSGSPVSSAGNSRAASRSSSRAGSTTGSSTGSSSDAGIIGAAVSTLRGLRRQVHRRLLRRPLAWRLRARPLRNTANSNLAAAGQAEPLRNANARRLLGGRHGHSRSHSRTGEESSARLQLKALRAVLRSRGAVSRQIVSRAAEAAALTGSDEASLAGSNTVWDGVFTSLSPTDTGGVFGSLLFVLLLALGLFLCAESAQPNLHRSKQEMFVWAFVQTVSSVILNYASFLGAICMLAVFQWRRARARHQRRLQLRLQREWMRHVREVCEDMQRRGQTEQAGQQPAEQQQTAQQQEQKQPHQKQQAAQQQKSQQQQQPGSSQNNTAAHFGNNASNDEAMRLRRKGAELLRMVSELEKLAALELRLEASDSELEELAAAYPEKIGSAWVSAGWRASLYRARGQEDAAFAQLQPT